MHDQILHRLRQDHRNIEPLLCILNRQFQRLAFEAADYELVERILIYLADYPDRYHHPFEELLMERLRVRRPEASETLITIHEHHVQLASEGVRLQQMLHDIIVGTPVSRELLRARGQGYVSLYRQHFRDEECSLFPRLAEALTPADWLQVTTTFQWCLNPLFDDTSTGVYRDLRDRIELELRTPLPAAGTGYCPHCAEG